MYYQQELVSFWMAYCPLNYYKQYQKAVSYVKNTKNTDPKNYGTLMIEKTGPVFIQTIQKLVRDITASMPERSPEEIIAYMRGVIAAEACINFRHCCCHRRVFITAIVEEEREIFRKCLHKLGIETQDCKPIKDVIISRRKNIIKLHELGLMTLSPEKRARFEEMVESCRQR